MIRTYLKIAIRNLRRYKGHAIINISGLAVGITCCILIMLFVRNEFEYDNFHSKKDRLYRVWQHEKYEGQDFINVVTPIPMANALAQTFGEVEATCRVYSFNPLVQVNGQSAFTGDVRMVDSTFFQLFDFNMVRGNIANPFPTSNSILITPESAKRYFGDADPVGRSINIKLGDENVPFTVSGIVDKAPEASSIRYQLLIPFSNSRRIFREGLHSNWFNVFLETYVMLKPGTSFASLQQKFPSMMKQQLGEDYVPGGFELHLQPITAIHLDPTLPAGNEPISNPKYSYILITIGVLILVVACINFITLSIGRSATRALEVGMRKVLGAERKQLVGQFWGESLVLTLISVVVGSILAVVLLRPFNQLINRDLSFQYDVTSLLFLLLLILLIALIAGIYPAVILSGFRPVEVLKGRILLQRDSGWLRRGLIIGQFVASIVMIICTIVAGQQLKYLEEKDLGYSKDQVVIVSTNKGREEGLKLATLMRTELVRDPRVSDAVISLFSLAETPWVQLGFTDRNKVYKSFQYNSIQPEFIPAMNIKMKEGRNFSASNPADQTSAAIVNEAFVKTFGLTDPVGKKLPGPFDQQIIGVVKDFHFESLHNPIGPLLLTIKPDSVFRRTENIGIASPPQPRLSVRFRSGNMIANLALLESTWKKLEPNQNFEYRFLDETLAAQYEGEQKASNIIRIASGLSIFIACIGLFGLTTLAVLRRTKEIGIRKVLGASVTSVVALLSKDFVMLVAISSLLAFPLAWWAIDKWLKDFAYRIPVDWWVFVLAAVVALLIALLTVSFQAIRAALANPVKSLRSE